MTERFGRVSEDGALGFQIPSPTYALVRRLIGEVAFEGPWAPRMQAPLAALLDALQSGVERAAFRDRLLERVAQAYPVQADGRILFPFRRTFVIAYA